MIRPARTYQIGDAAVTRIDELTLTAFTHNTLYPGSDPAVLERHRGTFGPGSVEPGTGILIQSIHTWLVQTPGHTMLIDTATGNGKHRPAVPIFDQLDTPYLSRLAAAGVRPEDVTRVLLTHTHADHVGWNTRLDGTRWVPSFPNARYVVSRLEQAYNEALADGLPPVPPPAELGPMLRTPLPGVYDDSLRPVVEAGLADLIEVGAGEVIPGMSFLRTPGHSIDHASIRLVSQGQEALFCGDIMHHPLQVYEPGLASCFCEFPQASLASRLRVLAQAADAGATVFTSHFAETSAGRVARAGDGFTWEFS